MINDVYYKLMVRYSGGQWDDTKHKFSVAKEAMDALKDYNEHSPDQPLEGRVVKHVHLSYEVKEPVTAD